MRTDSWPWLGSPNDDLRSARNHAFVSEKTWIGLDLPAKKDVPNLSLEVINFHRPLLGSRFHFQQSLSFGADNWLKAHFTRRLWSSIGPSRS